MVKDPHELMRILSSGKTLPVLFAFLLAPLEASEREISDFVGCTRKTARRSLRVLSNIGFVTRTQYRRGWILTAWGRDLILNSPALQLTTALALPHPTASQDLDELGNSETERVKITLSNPDELGNSGTNWVNDDPNWVNTDPNWVNPADSVLNTVVVESLNINTSTTDLESGLREKVRKICAATDVIWGAQIWPNVIDLVVVNERKNRPGNLEDLIGWIAHCHHNPTGRIHSPAATTAANIKAYRRPGRKYREHPGDYLPARFLREAGLETLIPIEIEPDPEPTPLGFEVERGVAFEPDPSVLEVVPGSHRTPEQAWESVTDQLRREMAINAWTTYVRDTQAWRFDPQSGILVVAVESAFVRDWLASRIQSTAGRMLVGMLNRDISVQFKTWADGEE